MRSVLLLLAACQSSPVLVSAAPVEGGAYPDRDGDGYGDPSGASALSGAFAGVDNALDCDDDDASVYPGAEETWADGFTDSDCDGALGDSHEVYTGPLWRGEGAGDEAGRRVANGGDLDSDGLGELLVAAPYAVTDGEDGGSVYRVVAGPGATLTAIGRLDGIAGSWLGSGLDGGVDVTGDGVPDVLVGAPGYGGDKSGGCALVSGADWADAGTLSIPKDAMGWVPGGIPDSYGGSACVFAGDVDGDGISEVAISAPYATLAPGIERVGLVALYSGVLVAAGVPLTLDDAIQVWVGDERQARLGNELAPMGDLDGDGAADLLISAWHNPVARIMSGRTGALLASISGDLLARPRRIGDVDGDGFADVAMVGPELRLHTDLAHTPFQMPPSAALVLRADAGFLDAQDLGDRDGDGAAETLLTAPYGQGGEAGWVGVVPGLAGLSLGVPHARVDVDALRLQASAASEDAYGYRSAQVPNLFGPGEDGLALGCYAQSDAGDHAGAVAAIPVPR